MKGQRVLGEFLSLDFEAREITVVVGLGLGLDLGFLREVS